MTIALSFDLGTTYFKATLVDETGALLALARRPTPIERPNEGWRQIQPDVFEHCLRQLLTSLREQDAAALGRASMASFATQTNSFVLLDEHDQPTTPIVLWNDRRAKAQRDWLHDWWEKTGSTAETGCPATSTECVPAKLVWMQENEPGAWRRSRRVRLIGDQLVAWLTGEHVTEAGAAGLTGLVNIHELQWRREATEALSLDDIELPTVRRAGADVGQVRQAIAQEFGLSPDCRVRLGCLDQYAGAIGAGNVHADGLSETTGTVLATVRLSDRFDPQLSERGVFQGAAWQAGLYWQMCFGNVSANLFEALRRAEPGEPDYETLTAEAEAVAAGADSLRLNAAASERQGEPVFEGETAAHGRGHRTRAVLEGVAAALRRQVDQLCGDARPGRINSVGGAARSDLWLQIKADTLGIPVAAMDSPEPTCLGAAALAFAGDGDVTLEQVVERVSRCRRVFEPGEVATR